MAVSNSCGSQIINICMGLGLPWFITNSAGHHIRVNGHRNPIWGLESHSSRCTLQLPRTLSGLMSGQTRSS